MTDTADVIDGYSRLDSAIAALGTLRRLIDDTDIRERLDAIKDQLNDMKKAIFDDYLATIVKEME